MATMPQPKVSVLMITYNHEPFIAQAIASVLMQQTSFPYELVIGEDCSTDGTRAIVEQFQRQYPAHIRLLLHPQNVGMFENFRQTYAACQGEYIAMLEGDDYWTDHHKLQQQIDFLNAHPTYAICFHQAYYRDDTVSNTHYVKIFPSETTPNPLPWENLLLKNSIPTCSVVFRQNIHTFPDWFRHLRFIDWFLHLFNAEYGAIHFIPKPMSVYRIHAGGSWSQKPIVQLLLYEIDAFQRMQQHYYQHQCHLYQQRQHLFRIRVARDYYVLAWQYLDMDDLVNAQASFDTCLRVYALTPFVRTRYKPSLWQISELAIALFLRQHPERLYLPLQRIYRLRHRLLRISIPVIHELTHLFPRLVLGGVQIIDHYGHWKRARKAVILRQKLYTKHWRLNGTPSRSKPLPAALPLTQWCKPSSPSSSVSVSPSGTDPEATP